MRNLTLLILLIGFINFGFSTFSSASYSEFTLNLTKCSNYDVVYLNNYLDENTLVSYSISNNIKKLNVDFAFPIYGYLYVKTNKKLYKIKINGSKNVELKLDPHESIYSISYAWYNLDCDYVKQLMLLNKNQKKCVFNKNKYNKLKSELLKLKKEIKEIENNLLYKKEYEKIISYYNQAVENLDNAKISYLANDCTKFNQNLEITAKYIHLLNKELNKNFFDLLLSLIFG